MIHSNHGLISHSSEINVNFGQNGKFSQPHVFNGLNGGFLLEFCNGDGAQSIRISKKCDDMRIRLDTLLAPERQMERGRKEMVQQYHALDAMYADVR